MDTDAPDGSWIEAALSAATLQLTRKQRELQRLSDEVHSLEVTIQSLRTLREVADRPIRRIIRRPADGGSSIPQIADPEPTPQANLGRLPQPPRRKQSASSSTLRVVRILMEQAGEGSLELEELQREFVRRGWAEESWEDPMGAITQAARRSSHYGFTRRIGAKRFVVTPEGIESLREAEARESSPGGGGGMIS